MRWLSIYFMVVVMATWTREALQFQNRDKTHLIFRIHNVIINIHTLIYFACQTGLLLLTILKDKFFVKKNK